MGRHRKIESQPEIECLLLFFAESARKTRKRERDGSGWMWVRREVFIPLMADQNTVSRQPGCVHEVAAATLETTHSAPASSGECLFACFSALASLFPCHPDKVSLFLLHHHKKTAARFFYDYLENNIDNFYLFP